MIRTLAMSALAVALAIPAFSADEKTISPFNGKDLKGWKLKDQKKSKWEAFEHSQPFLSRNPSEFEPGAKEATTGAKLPSTLVNTKPGSCDIYTEANFGDCTIEVEFLVPEKSNSGVYVMGEYEVQILSETFGKPDAKLAPSDMGGIYTYAAPKVNACKKPGE